MGEPANPEFFPSSLLYTVRAPPTAPPLQSFEPSIPKISFVSPSLDPSLLIPSYPSRKDPQCRTYPTMAVLLAQGLAFRNQQVEILGVVVTMGSWPE